MKPVPLSRDKHARKKVRPMTDFRSIAGSSQIFIYGAEIGRVMHDFPLVFSAQPEGTILAGLTALRPGGNVYVDAEGRWQAPYLPALLRRAPFVLGRVEDKDDWILCVDEDNVLLSDDDGAPLFDPDGTPTEAIRRATALLGELEKNRKATLNACAALSRHALLVPWSPRRQNGVEETFPGLMRIDEERLKSLSPEALVELHGLGALMLVYAHLFSLDRVALLERLEAQQAQRAQELAAQALAAGHRATDLDRLFGLVDDEPFQF